MTRARSQWRPRSARSLQTEARRCWQRLGAVPRLAVVLGSGFRDVAEGFAVHRELDTRDIAGHPPARVPGHAGRWSLAEVSGVPVLLIRGRIHFYEGHDMAAVTFPVRLLAAMGVETLILTNAAGAIHPRYRAGDLMVVRDHINFMGTSALREIGFGGAEDFVDLCGLYDESVSALMKRAARRHKIPVREGVYLAVAGPNYETPAEIRAFRRWGADAVGMSTVPEAIVARRLGLRVAAVSCLTNLASGRATAAITHEEVLAAAGEWAARNRLFLNELVGELVRA